MHEYGHAVASTVLKCNGTTLIDPMCLNDYPAIDPAAGAVFEVTVSALYTGHQPSFSTALWSTAAGCDSQLTCTWRRVVRTQVKA